MATKKAWRDSACLIMAIGRSCNYIDQCIFKTSVSSANSNAPLPVCLTPNYEKEKDQFDVLFVKRNSTTKFMANTHVFPGGVLDKADYSSEWLTLFNTNVQRSSEPFSSLNTSPKRLPIYSAIPNSAIPGEVAFRICAIREMFEESGVILARAKSDVGIVADLLPGSFQPSVKWLPKDTLQYWRSKIHANAEEFLSFCREFDCVPDIWSLIEWSNWLTPRNYHRRYDTVFYFCCPTQKPLTYPDITEVSLAEWLTPYKAIELHKSSGISLSPPQFTEVALLNQLGTLPCAHSYALSNSLLEYNVHSRHTVRMLTKDNYILSLKLDDDLFPIEYMSTLSSATLPAGIRHHCQASHLKDCVHIQTVDNIGYEYECLSHTAEQLRRISNSISRMEVFNMKNIDLYTTSTKVEDHIQKYKKYLSDCSVPYYSKL